MRIKNNGKQSQDNNTTKPNHKISKSAQKTSVRKEHKILDKKLVHYLSCTYTTKHLKIWVKTALKQKAINKAKYIIITQYLDNSKLIKCVGLGNAV